MPFPVFQPSTVYGAGSPYPVVDYVSPVLYAVYLAVIFILMIYAVHLYVFVVLRRRLARRPPPPEPAFPAAPPKVSLQIPIYNEGLLAVRAVETAAAIDYPRELLEIIILDGSTDGTTDLVADAVERARAAGADIRHHIRDNSKGFKAGALIEGCQMTRAELIAVFDADFYPQRDFLRHVVGCFDDPRVGCVQTRWGHRNADASLLTIGQAIILDAFYGTEMPVRSSFNLATFFTGTCGVWRKRCIVDAGGWQTDTLAEDMDVSIRAQVRGWRIVYNQQVMTPGELPESVDGYLRQQHRWTMGHTQVCFKHSWRVLTSSMPLRKRVELIIHLFRWLSWPCMLAVALLMMPMLLMHPQLKQLSVLESLGAGVMVVLAMGAASVFYLSGQAALYPQRWLRSLLYIPALVGVGITLAPNNCRAIAMALLRRREPFRKTPRVSEGPQRVRGAERYMPWVNLVLGVYMAVSFAVTIVAAIRIEAWGFFATAVGLGLFAAGLLVSSTASVLRQIKTTRARDVARPAASPS